MKWGASAWLHCTSFPRLGLAPWTCLQCVPGHGLGVVWQSYPSIFLAVLQQNPVLDTLPRVEGKVRSARPSLPSPFVLSNFSKTTRSTIAGKWKLCSREEGHPAGIRLLGPSVSSVLCLCVALSLTILVYQVGCSYLLCSSPATCRGLKSTNKSVKLLSGTGSQTRDTAGAVLLVPENVSPKPGLVCTLGHMKSQPRRDPQLKNSLFFY